MELLDDDLMVLYSSIKTAKDTVPGLEDRMEVPQMVIAGMQSAGKTTFVEALVGFPIGFTSRSTGTRCPVRYILRHDTSSKYRVGGREWFVEAKEIAEKVKRHMEVMAERNEFSRETLVVEIQGSGIANLDITDLPGIVDTGDAKYKRIVKVVKPFLSESSIIPVIVLTATNDIQSNQDVTAMRRVGLREDARVIYVANRFKQQLEGWEKVSDVNSYCSDWITTLKDPYFVSLIYRSSFNKEDKTFEELEPYFGSLAKEEAKVTMDIISKKRQDEPLDDSVCERLGLRGIVAAMKGMLVSATREGAAKWSKVLYEKRRELADQEATLKDLLEEHDFQARMHEARKYMIHFQSTMASIHGAAENRIDNVVRTGPFDPEQDFAFNIQNHPVTTTWEDEIQHNPDLANERKHGKSMKRLRKELVGSAMLRDLHEHLAPHAAYQRVLKMSEYLIMDYAYNPATRGMILSMNGRGSSSATGHLDKPKVVRGIVMQQMNQLQHIVAALAKHVRWIYTNTCEPAHVVLQKNFPRVWRMKAFRQEVDKTFQRFLRLDSKRLSMCFTTSSWRRPTTSRLTSPLASSAW